MGKTILAIDPGTTQSAYVLLEPSVNAVWEKGILPNEKAILRFRDLNPDEAVIEMVASYGMPVGKEVFETCVWIGMFKREIQLLGIPVNFAYRKDIKVHLCGSTKAKDRNIRQRLIDLIGPQGTKKTQGPTYGFKADMWAALACAVFYAETHCGDK